MRRLNAEMATLVFTGDYHLLESTASGTKKQKREREREGNISLPRHPVIATRNGLMLTIAIKIEKQKAQYTALTGRAREENSTYSLS